MQLVTEGSTLLLVPPKNLGSVGPGTAERDAPFYNPAMAANRDLSLLTVATHQTERNRSIDVADVLAGTGARTLRLAKECGGELEIYANDGDPNGIAGIEAGIERNQIADGRIHTRIGGAHAFLASRRFDVVDIDPFGSPSTFLDSAMYATRHRGILLLTCTDTGALHGTFPKACRRRYGAEPYHGAAWRGEVGLRILLGVAARSAGRFERGIVPLWSISKGHWLRVAIRVMDGKERCDASYHTVQTQDYDDANGRTKQGTAIGPMWMGSLHDEEFVAKMIEQVESVPPHDKEIPRLLGLMQAECPGPPFWTSMEYMQNKLGDLSQPRREAWMQALRDGGHDAYRSHLDTQGVRTNANFDEMAAAWKAAYGYATIKSTL